MISEQYKYLLQLYSTYTGCKVSLIIKINKDRNEILSSFYTKEFNAGKIKILLNHFSEECESSGPGDGNNIKVDKKLKNLGIEDGFKKLLFHGEFSDFYLLGFNRESDKKTEDINISDLIIRSISERLEFEEQINKKYIETTSNINTVIYSTNADGTKYYFISDSVQRLFGLTEKQIINNRIALLRRIVPEHFKGYSNFIKELKSGKKAEYEYEILDSNGRSKWVRHTGNPVIINGNVQRVVGIIEDITEERIIRDKLAKSEEKFRLLVEAASDLIMSLNSFGYVSLVNKNGARSLGFKPEELLGKHFLELVEETTKNDTIDAFQKILSSEDSIDFEVNLIDKFENPVLFDFHATPTKDEGVISGMLAIGRDITKRKRDETRVKELNTKLLEANRLISIERDRAKQQLTVLEELNNLKSEFVSRISHELRTPLASIVGFAETIVSDQDMPKEMVYEFSNIILTEGKRLAKLVNDVLDFSKLESINEEVHKKDMDLIKTLLKLSSSFEKYAAEQKVTLNFELPEAEIVIFADQEMIEKSFIALIKNGIKHNRQDGRVSVIVQDFLNEVEVIISDTGVGISAEDLPQLFDKFSKLNATSGQTGITGLNMAYVKQVIDIHRGLIQVKSKIDEGTTFIIRLPKKK